MLLLPGYVLTLFFQVPYLLKVLTESIFYREETFISQEMIEDLPHNNLKAVA